MDLTNLEKYNKTQSSISASQFSSKSFSSSSFSTHQTSKIESSNQNFNERLSSFNSKFKNLSSDFPQLSLSDSNNAIVHSSSFGNFEEPFPSKISGFEDQGFRNISLSQKQNAQYSNRTVTSTVSSKVITKKITRKVVNGEIVEEEEEIDEIENEPVTAQFTEENSSNDVIKTATVKQGGRFFDMFKSKTCPEIIEPNAQIRDKPRAIEGPKDRTSKIKSIFGFGKKKKGSTKIGNVQPIIDELLKTEENYVKDLRMLVDQIMPELERPDAPQELQKDKGKLFGNVEIIFMFHDVQFLTDLKESEKNPEEIANCFLKHKKEFSMYRYFNRNQPVSEVYVGKYGSFFNNKITELQQLDLRNFLIKPTQRLCRYTLLLEQLLKECEKHKLSSEDTTSVKQALEMTRTETRLGNDLMALDAIKDCHIDLKDQGELIYRDPFTVQRGTDPEFKAMVFLFEKIVLFTKSKLENNVDVLYYQDFIYLKDVGLTEYPNDSKKFEVWFKRHTLKPYKMKTTNEKIKIKWVEEIRTQLQAELDKNKEQQRLSRTLYNVKDLDKNNINIIP